MASRTFSLYRSLSCGKLSITTFSRSYTASSSSVASTSYLSFFHPSLLSRVRPLAAIAHNIHGVFPAHSVLGSYRALSTRQTQSSLNDSSPNWSNRPPKETILLDGCDFEHWLVVLEKPDDSMTRDEIIDMYIETLAQVVGSKEEARMKIYSVSTKHYFAFGALVSEELSYKLKEIPKVRWVLPDSYLDVKNKDYGGEPFINGQAVPYDPKYHEEWVRNNAKAMERNRRNDRPRNFDRSRNFERRRHNMQGQSPLMSNQMQNPPPNMGGQMPPQNNMGGQMPPQNNMGGQMPTPSNMGVQMPPPSNMGGQMPPPSNMGGHWPPPSNMGGQRPPPNNMGGQRPPPNNMGGQRPPSNNMGGGMPPNIGGQGPMGGGMPPNMGGGVHPNIGGGASGNMGRGAPNIGGYSNSGWQGNSGNMPNYQSGGSGFPQHQSGPGQNYQGNYGAGSNSGMVGGGPGENPNYQGQRDMPPPPNYRQ